jgi:hypothetical protein
MDFQSDRIEIVENAVFLTEQFLSEGGGVHELPQYVFPYAIEYALRSKASSFEVNAVLDILLYACDVSYQEQECYVTDQTIGFIIKVLNSSTDNCSLLMSLECLCSLTDGNPNVSERFDGVQLYYLSVNQASDQLARKLPCDAILSRCFQLCCQCFAYFELPAATASDFVNQIVQIFDYDPSYAWRLIAVRAIAHLAYFRRNEPLLHAIRDDSIISRILSTFSTGNEPLISEAFYAIDNLAFHDLLTGLKFLNSDFLQLDYQPSWKSYTFLRFCGAIATLFGILHEAISADVSILGSLGDIRNQTANVATVLVDHCEEGSIAVRRAAGHALSQIIGLNDSRILHGIVGSYEKIVICFCQLLLIKDDALVSSILMAMIVLLEFEDRILAMKGNIIMKIELEYGIRSILDEVLETCSDVDNICRLVEAAKRVIELCLGQINVDYG